MIADDIESVRDTLKDVILSGKHELVAEAVDGVDTLKKFHSIKPDVLLLDITMPKKDGVATLKEIMKSTPAAKVIMITAHDDMGLIQDCITAGASAYIVKPFHPDEVLKSISFAFEEK